MSDTINCQQHGEQTTAFVCSHLADLSVALGFNYSEDNQGEFPDAWCDNCEIIRAAHDGWNEESEALTKIRLVCAACYARTRIRNTRPPVSLEDLSELRWKCGTCEELHIGPCLDFGYDKPHYWSDELECNTSHLNEDFCSIEDQHFFVRGVIELPIIGSDQVFCWGVWGSLSKENFERVANRDENSTDGEDGPMFSWLSSQIVGYPETINLKMKAHKSEPGERPRFELEPTDHPLSQEQQKGIYPERIRQITLGNGRGAHS